MLDGEKDRTGFAGVTVPDRLTVPVNPLTLVKVMPILMIE